MRDVCLYVGCGTQVTLLSQIQWELGNHTFTIGVNTNVGGDEDIVRGVKEIPAVE